MVIISDQSTGKNSHFFFMLILTRSSQVPYLIFYIFCRTNLILVVSLILPHLNLSRILLNDNLKWCLSMGQCCRNFQTWCSWRRNLSLTLFTNENDNYFRDMQNNVWLVHIFGILFPIGGLVSLWSRGFTIFQSRVSKLLLSNSKAIITCEDKKRSQIVPAVLLEERRW